MKENRANEGSEPRTGYVIQEDGTIVVYLAGGDTVFKFIDGTEEVLFADGTHVSWDCNSVLV
ncbi:MAG TPA: hypothetical protein EYN91_26840 [Candidatus Melainabacteria bacterium]|nr:hypothetical protein [Candidatus Melainabacteria bacterium]HIN67298.1 hypothetical protein [Candidatus Obscuribacterales bacterium]